MKSLILPFRNRCIRGFTLIEILVGVALLAIIGLLIVQIVGVTTRVTRMSNSGIDAAAQARLAFDRMGLDLRAMVRRPDIDFVASSQIGTWPSNALTFFSEVTSPGVASSNNRGASLVSYQINSSPDSTNACLLRGATPLTWSDTNSRGITGLQTNGLPVPISSLPFTLKDTDFDVLAPAVIRVVVGYQLFPSAETVHLQSGASVVAQGQIVYSPPVLLDNSNSPSSMIDRTAICSLIVGVVAIDPESLKFLVPMQVSALADSFPVPSNGELPVSVWTPIADNTSDLPASVPLPARQSVRVFQRAFPLNPYGVPPQ